ncbi:ribonuclease [Listeria monocytogenes]|nr:ribonuclease [Listeria monocytogenes]EHK2486473.1 ribonuclease [Listeria monocytogenes]EHP2906494.1 ribonuclease [Listeria monocytogenes]EHP2951090.1 ribonuclease [Listeria monocytogenes]EHP3118437.1 ribonuclease [Listeria monocytogenes]
METGNGANSSKNVALYEKYKDVLGTTEKANPLVDSLRETGKLPDNFISKDLAIEKGWRPGKALENYVPGGQIGGDIYQNSTKLLPEVSGRVWREADVGLIGDMSRAKQAGTRLLYSNDGLLYITTDHYKTMHFIGNY